MRLLGGALLTAVSVGLVVAACSNDYALTTPPSADAGTDSSSTSASASSSSSSGSSTSSSLATTSSSSSSSSSSSGDSGDAGYAGGGGPCVTAGVDLSALDCTNYSVETCARRPNLDPHQTLNQANDLVRCDAAQQAVCVIHCAQGCVGLFGAFDDQCDPCQGLADGNYCGKDVGWLPSDANVVLSCAGGTINTAIECGHKTCDRTTCAGATDLTTCCH